MDERERCYTRIKRGMVFWYNIDSTVDKFDVPEIKVSEKKSFRDYLEYGDRPWLLVSIDEKNVQGRTCTVIPLCTNSVPERDNDRFHVPIKFKGKNAIILCEHLRTINCSELIKYDCTLEDNVMEKVESAIGDYLGIRRENPFDSLVSSNIVARLEGVINDIVKRKVEEERRRALGYINVDDAVLRISEGLETLFEVDTKGKEKEEKKKDEIPEVKVETKPEVVEDVEPIESTVVEDTVYKKKRISSKKEVSLNRNSKTTQTRWDKSLAISFIQEEQIIGAEDMAKKYGYANGASVCKTIKYLENKYSLK